MASSKRRIGLREVRALGEGETVWDAAVPGFGARRQRSPAVSYVLLYRTKEGRQRWHTIGRSGAPWTPDEARTEAQRILREVAHGKDPVGAKKELRQAATVAELCDQYLADARAGRLLTKRGGTKKASTLYTDGCRIERHVKPLLGHLKVGTVTREDVEAFMHDVAEGRSVGKGRSRTGAPVRGGKGAASRTVGLLGGIFGYAAKRRMRSDNPTQGITRYQDGRRERRLTDAEYLLFAAGLAAAAQPATTTSKHGRPAGAVWPGAIAAARFLLLTGWRKGEVLGLRWREVDLARRTARLHDTKTGLSVRPLSHAACAVLLGQRDGKAEDYVFPTMDGESRMGGFPWLFARITRAGGLSADVTPHVLRHSFASVAADLGYSESTIAVLVGHKGHSVTSRYVHSADAVLLAAADVVADRVAELMGEAVPKGTVLTLPKARSATA